MPSSEDLWYLSVDLASEELGTQIGLETLLGLSNTSFAVIVAETALVVPERNLRWV